MSTANPSQRTHSSALRPNPPPPALRTDDDVAIRVGPEDLYAVRSKRVEHFR